MNVDSSSLLNAHDRLSAAVRKETAKAYRYDRTPTPPDHVIYRNRMDVPDRATIIRLGRIAKGLADQVAAEGYTMTRAEPDDDALGSTNNLTKEVRLASNLRPEREVATLVHELAHIRLRHHRRGVMGTMSRELAEVEAESVSYIVAQALGLDVLSFSAPYVANWCRGEVELTRMSAPRVLKVAEQILADL